MQDVIDSFEDRVKELDRFFDLLDVLNSAGSLLSPHPATSTHNIDLSCLPILKATVFLLIYNLVESSIRNGLSAVYDKVLSEKVECESLCDEFRKIWVEQQFRALDRFTASAKNYEEKAHELVLMLLSRNAVVIDSEKLPVTGNLNADAIRRVCEKHGIDTKTGAQARGGFALENVRAQRNNLAHGFTSFEECGRQYSVDDLKRAKEEAVVFVREILTNIRKFADRAAYLRKS